MTRRRRRKDHDDGGQPAGLSRRILQYLSRSGARPLKPSGLVRKLGLSSRDLDAVRHEVDRLVSTGRLVARTSGRVIATSSAGLVTGTISRTAGGAGYVSVSADPERLPPPDIYVAPADLGGAFDGDEVLVELLDRRRRAGQRCGRVERVVKRASTRFVGSFQPRGGSGWVQLDGTAGLDPIAVDDAAAAGAQPGDKVVIEMLSFPTAARRGSAVVVEVLGAQGKSGVDEATIIHEFGLPIEFPAEVLDEAREVADRFNPDDLDGRLDLTGETLVTIDPADARDFDDAISLERRDDGGWKLGVHISDVAWFVARDGALDREARRRGTSVYLPGRVLPMFPEMLSNGLASLQQGRLRYARSAFIEYHADGTPQSASFARTAIRVTRRLAYERVQEVLDDPGQGGGRIATGVRELLLRMAELARLLRRQRAKAGAIELTLPEVRIELDRQGRVSGAHEVQHNESHRLIEEFMLAANVAVARELSARGLCFLRRTHDEPSPQRLERFATFARELGLDIPPRPTRPNLQAVLDRVAGKRYEQAVNYALLRSMRRAEYSPHDIGHYALAADDYCHFTSPIRRYPDLIVHRLLDSVIDRRKPRGGSLGQVAELGRHCSATERRAESAERALVRLKMLLLLADRVGEVLETRVTRVERFGLFCRGLEWPVEGLLPVDELSSHESFEFDSRSLTLFGRKSGTAIRLGDSLTVRVAHVDLDRRELRFVPEGRLPKPDGTRRPGSAKPKPKSKPKSGRRDRGRRRRRRSRRR